MEDEEGIGLILARATELRLKINDCIEDVSSASASSGDGENSGGTGSSPGEGREGKGLENGEEKSDPGIDGEVEEYEGEEAERLLHIRDALESLESQLAALQNLRQRQQYERQVALSEIDYSRKMLLEKLKEYKGKDFEVLRETSAFAGERVEYESDLLLPPYPIRPPLALVPENGYLPHLPSKQKNDRNGLVSSSPKDEVKRNTPYRESENSSNRVIRFVGSVAKIMLPIIGVISILTASGYGPEIRKRGASLKLLRFLQPQANGEKRSSVQCPPGKVLVMEGGEAHCLVKERVEVPFDSVVPKRDVTYGYG
ncbi:PREDICTED: plastid division protein PDV2 [Tarenaya hassleriana]|uniref:plastid division protein PDV2 n=1 Tax=Tarenaya hassleriana TaxID=28532 RepID=UPI00053C9851|nr:PREDICTED: plastid division protein PDV2 [Tarenaya hassleriana]